MSVISTLMLLIFLSIMKLSQKFYEKYKLKELEIRNNLKLGSPSQNEFHIDKILSIYFQKKLMTYTTMLMLYSMMKINSLLQIQ